MMITQNYNDKNAFSEIYVTYFPRMLRFSRAYLTNREEAENVVQDIFVNLWENRMFLEEIDSPQAFLFTLVKRRCIDFLRKKLASTDKESSLDEVENHELQYKLYSLEAFDETKFSDEEIECIVRKAVDHLPERCRHIFIESKLNNKKCQEIADEMGLSVQTVKNQLTIAVHKLREELKDCLPLLILLFEKSYLS